MRSSVWIILAIAAVFGPAAWADSLKVGRIPYGSVRVVAFKDGQLEFSVNGSRIKKPLSEIADLRMDGKISFNKAQEAMDKDDAKAAVVLYDAAFDSESEWLAELIRYRRLPALAKAGLTFRAVEDWVKICGDSDNTAEALQLRPSGEEATAGEDTKKAIALLKQRQAASTSKAFQEAVNSLLLKLYEKQGQEQQAAELAEKIAGGGAKPPAKGESGEAARAETPMAARGAVQAQLKALDVLLRQGKAGDVVQQIEAKLPSLAQEDLAEALLLRGQARLKLAGNNRQKVLEAGLDFMRVATYFGQSAQAPAALLGAAQVNLMVGNGQGAWQALETLVRQFPDSPEAKTAQAELDKLKAQ